MKNQYEPDTVSPPGDTLWDWMICKGIQMHGGRDVEWVVENLGLRFSLAERLLWNQLEITPDIAQKLEKATQIPAAFWLERERRYRESRTHQAGRQSPSAGEVTDPE